MEQLNLRSHSPDEFPGKSVEIDGRTYVIGGLANKTATGHAHFLVNTLSGLCLHIAQIRLDYQTDPDGAHKASLAKAGMHAKMRLELLQKGEGETLRPMQVIEAASGSLEIHEIPWAVFTPPEDTRTHEMIGQAVKLMDQRRFAAAGQQLASVLSEYPNHTEALALLANCHGQMSDFIQGYDAMRSAVAIEPNYLPYRGQQLYFSLKCPVRRQALHDFEALKKKFPTAPDYDVYGIYAALLRGDPIKARDTLLKSPLARNQGNGLAQTISDAIAAKTLYHHLESRLERKGNPEIDQAMLAELEEIAARYPVSPLIQANLGFSLRSMGFHERAADLLLNAAGGLHDRSLLVCLANAAFSLIELQQYDRAIGLLSTVYQVLSSQAKDLHPVDLPGSTLWIFGEVKMIETTKVSPFEALERAISHCTDRALITPELLEMMELYRQLAALYAASATDDAAVKDSVSHPAGKSKKSWWRRFWFRR